MNLPSIVVPLYNQGIYLKEALDSVAANLMCPLEVVIVDDASTDDSYAVASQLVREYPFKITLLRHEFNKGLSAARNTGIAATKGSCLICLDSDDVIPANYISEMRSTMVSTGADVVYARSMCFGASYEEYDCLEYDEQTLRRHNFINCSALFKKCIIEVVGGYDERMKAGWEDYDLWLRAAKAGFKFNRCLSTHLSWRRKPGSMVEQALLQQNEIRKYLKEKHGGYYTA